MLTLYRLISFFDALPYTDTYRTAAAAILNNLRTVPALSIEELAELSYSSPTTLNRLVRKLGCANFSAFKRELRNALDSYDLNIYRMGGSSDININPDPSTYFSLVRRTSDMLEAIATPPLLEQICRELHNHRRIRLYTDVRDCCIDPDKRQLQMDLITDGKDAAFYSDPESCLLDAQNLDKDTMVILPCSTYLPAFQQTLKLAQLAKACGAFTLILAEKNTPHIAAWADILFSFTQLMETSEGHIINQFLVLLSLRYCNMRNLAERAPNQD